MRNPAGGTLPGFVPNPRYSSFSMALSNDPEAVLKGLPKDIRYMIRKAEKADLRVQRGPDLLDEFYRLFAINMRRLGTPVFPRALFVNLLEEFGKQIDVLVVYAGPEPVASAVSFLFRDTMHPYYIGGLPVARDLAANNFLWWELMKFAAQSGMNTFDFGRSKKGRSVSMTPLPLKLLGGVPLLHSRVWPHVVPNPEELRSVAARLIWPSK